MKSIDIVAKRAKNKLNVRGKDKHSGTKKGNCCFCQQKEKNIFNQNSLMKYAFRNMSSII